MVRVVGDAGLEGDVIIGVEADIQDLRIARRHTLVVIPGTIHAVVSIFEERTNVLGEVGERTVNDAVVGASAVSSDTKFTGPHLGLIKVA